MQALQHMRRLRDPKGPRDRCSAAIGTFPHVRHLHAYRADAWAGKLLAQGIGSGAGGSGCERGRAIFSVRSKARIKDIVAGVARRDLERRGVVGQA